MDTYPATVRGLRKAFLSGKTKCLEWRKQQLDALLNFLDQERTRLSEALKKDLNKPATEISMFEIDYCKNDAIDCLNNLKKWTKPKKVKKGFLHMMDGTYIMKEPLGVCLIIGAWNYPVQLTILPLIGAIAAGNCVFLKPSEVSWNTALVLERYLPNYLDNECIKVINGGVPETTALLNERFDHIFYTGNSTVGKIVMSAAAKHLTPVTLELGGKSPVFVDNNTDLSIVARRLMWGKCCNSGQICIAPDYVMCTKETQDALVPHLKSALQEFYPDGVECSPDYCRIVSDGHFQRLKKLLEESTNIVIGGDMNESERFMSPTVVTDTLITDKLMQEEIFGPILPIVPMGSVEEAVQYINTREKPLCMYIFTNNKRTVKHFKINTSSGSLVINDTIMQANLSTLPFGGVGHSGTGSYHGRFTFDTFSHRRSVMNRGLKSEMLTNPRYPPYTDEKLRKVNFFTKKSRKTHCC